MESALDLENQIETSECIHSVDYKTLYFSYSKTNQMKMVTKILDLRKLAKMGHKAETVKLIKMNCLSIWDYYKRKNVYSSRLFTDEF